MVPNRATHHIFENNGYPKSFADICSKKYLDKVFIKKEVLKASKKEFTCILPFIGKKKSLQLRTPLVNTVESNLKFCNFKVIFQSPCKLNSLFPYKDSLIQICDRYVRFYLNFKHVFIPQKIQVKI